MNRNYSDNSKKLSVLDNTPLRYILPGVLIAVAVCFIVYGIFDKEVNAVFEKAIELCKECVGIG